MDIKHQFDQMEAMLRDLAPALAKYKKYLKEAGFNETQAFLLVKEYQKTLFNQQDNK